MSTAPKSLNRSWDQCPLKCIFHDFCFGQYFHNCPWKYIPMSWVIKDNGLGKWKSKVHFMNVKTWNEKSCYLSVMFENTAEKIYNICVMDTWTIGTLIFHQSYCSWLQAEAYIHLSHKIDKHSYVILWSFYLLDKSSQVSCGWWTLAMRFWKPIN